MPSVVTAGSSAVLIKFNNEGGWYRVPVMLLFSEYVLADVVPMGSSRWCCDVSVLPKFCCHFAVKKIKYF